MINFIICLLIQHKWEYGQNVIGEDVKECRRCGGLRMKTMRERFEKLPEINIRLSSLEFNDHTNKYDGMLISDPTENYVNGAWCAFQEQQKKIYAVLQYISDEKWMDEYGDYHCPVLKIQELLNESQQE